MLKETSYKVKVCNLVYQITIVILTDATPLISNYVHAYLQFNFTRTCFLCFNFLTTYEEANTGLYQFIVIQGALLVITVEMIIYMYLMRRMSLYLLTEKNRKYKCTQSVSKPEPQQYSKCRGKAWIQFSAFHKSGVELSKYLIIIKHTGTRLDKL